MKVESGKVEASSVALPDLFCHAFSVSNLKAHEMKQTKAAMSDKGGATEVQREAKLQIAILVLVLLSIVLIVIDLLANLSTSQRHVVYTTDFVICVILAVEFAFRFKTSDDRFGFLKKNWYEVFALIPAYAFSLLELSVLSAPARSLRLLRVFRIVQLSRMVRLLRLVAVYARVVKFLDNAWGFVLESKISYPIVLTFVLVAIGSIAIYDIEHSAPSSQIKSLFDAFWWTLTTLTTVGYGDKVPTTVEGKVIGIALMVFGIALWTVAISLLTAALVERRHERKSLYSEVVSLIQRHIGRIDELTPKEKKLLARLVDLTSEFSNFKQTLTAEDAIKDGEG